MNRSATSAANAGADGPHIIDAAQHAFVDEWVSSMWVGVAMDSVALVILVLRGPGATDPVETAVVEPGEIDKVLEAALA